MYDFAGKVVLITGGSKGIGATFARELASRKANLILVARTEASMRVLAQSLSSEYGIRVGIVVADLSRPEGAKQVYEAVAALGQQVDVLINNAGFAAYGAFEEVPASTHLGQIAVNVTALVELTYLFLPQIVERKGGVISVASTAAFHPIPYMAVYGATKAFVLSFSEALWAEYRPLGVRVLALCPGATDTPFFERAGEEAAFGTKAHPKDVVNVGLRAFGRNRSHVVQGVQNNINTAAPRWLPRAAMARIAARIMRPKKKLAAKHSAT